MQILAVTVAALVSLQGNGKIGWEEDYDRGMKLAALNGGVAMVFFTSDN